MSMRKFGVITDIATSEIEKIYRPVRLQGEGWYIEVKPNPNMNALEIRCCGSVLGESEMIVRPSTSNVIHVSSTASERG